MTITALLDRLRLDFLYALRTLRKSPVFVLTAVLTLAMGIGGNTAIFTVIRSVLLQPLPYREPARLIYTAMANPRRRGQDSYFTLQRYQQMSGAHSLSALAAYFVATEQLTISGAGEPESLTAARISANYLSVLGVEPALGRGFLPEEDRAGGPAAVMISDQLWKRRFSGDRAVAGKAAILNSVPYTIVGVLPIGFDFPSAGIDVWLPRPAEYSAMPPQAWLTAPILVGCGRLRPGATIEQARAELNLLNGQFSSAHPGLRDIDPDATMRVVLLRDQLVANVRTLLWMLFGAVGFVLLIACANAASLLLARASSRSREFALRAALGADRTRIICQLLAESLSLAIAGGALGVILARWALSALSGMSGLRLPRTGEIHLDPAVLAFTVALSVVTGVLFGLFPSLQASRPDLVDALRESGAGAGLGTGRCRAFGISPRGALVVVQVALSIVLLIAAALLMESFARLHQVDPGFQPDHLLTMRIALPPARYNTGLKRVAFFEELQQRVEALPGVRAATVAQTLPTMSPRYGSAMRVAEQPPMPAGELPVLLLQSVTPGYFRALGIPIRRGREFTVHDDIRGAPLVLVINESAARRFWPAWPGGPNPVGQHLLFNQQGAPLEIVGVSADVHEMSLSSSPGPEVYLPCALRPPQTADLGVRTSGDPLRFANAVRSEVLAIDRDQSVSAIDTMERVLERTEGQRHVTLLLLDVFAAVALLLAVVGIYGAIAYSVAQRTQELGIRRALGAQHIDILRLVVGQGFVLALAGVTAGSAAAFALTRVMRDLLFQTSATDPLTFAAIGLLFIAVALAAAYIPARRASRIDPMSALRAG